MSVSQSLGDSCVVAVFVGLASSPKLKSKKMARRGKNTLVAGIEDEDLSNTAIAQTSQKTAGSPERSFFGYVCDHGDVVSSTSPAA